MKNEPGEILIPFDIYKEETGKNNTAYSSTKISTAPPTSLKQTPVYFVKGVFIADFPFVTEGEKKDQFLTDWPFFCSVGRINNLFILTTGYCLAFSKATSIFSGRETVVAMSSFAAQLAARPKQPYISF